MNPILAPARRLMSHTEQIIVCCVFSILLACLLVEAVVAPGEEQHQRISGRCNVGTVYGATVVSGGLFSRKIDHQLFALRGLFARPMFSDVRVRLMLQY